MTGSRTEHDSVGGVGVPGLCAGARSKASAVILSPTKIQLSPSPLLMS